MQYFEQRRSIATSLYLTGAALGGFVVPPLVSFLLAGEFEDQADTVRN
jgi:hypothetical protein